MSETVKLILQIILEGSAILGLLIALMKTIVRAIKEKNWKPLLTLAMKLMVEAETSFDTGDARKKFVIDTIKASSEYANYDISDVDLEKLIDDIVKVTKKINTK